MYLGAAVETVGISHYVDGRHFGSMGDAKAAIKAARVASLEEQFVATGDATVRAQLKRLGV